MKNYITAYYQSSIGIFKVVGSEAALHELVFTDLQSAPVKEVHPCLRPCFEQLDEYFAGERRDFDLDLEPEGTLFQQRVWQELLKIPYGKTTTYRDLAVAIGNPKAIRAVGAANGKNRIPIIIPCHRVIGSNGALVGFGGGIWRKEYLLKLEHAVLV